RERIRRRARLTGGRGRLDEERILVVLPPELPALEALAAGALGESAAAATDAAARGGTVVSASDTRWYAVGRRAEARRAAARRTDRTRRARRSRVTRRRHVAAAAQARQVGHAPG